MDFKFLQELIVPAQTKIVLLVMDGLGGLPIHPGGKTELETACTPNIDSLARISALGLTLPVAPGITPGSGPGHMALFGYDPIQFEIGRGVLEALGVGFDLEPEDVAARGNFCTLDQSGIIVDRRAGRIPTDASIKLAEVLNSIHLDGVEIRVKVIKEHRFALVFHAPGLGASLTETDPQKTGVPPLPVSALEEDSEKTARYANQFIAEAKRCLASQSPANAILLRGFAKYPSIPAFTRLYGLRAAAIALHGMYRGVAKVVGMDVLTVQGDTLDAEFTALEQHWDSYDFFYLHVKKTDTTGENGDFQGKIQAIEEVDSQIPRLMALQPDVIIIGGDHSSPAVLKSHSWHPVPVLLYSDAVRPDGIAEFGERACLRGSLGILPAKDLMPLAMANARRITKWSA